MSLNDLLAQLQVDYINGIPAKVSFIESKWLAREWPELEDEFHKIKGTGKTYGLPEVSVLGEAMEKICAYGQTSEGARLEAEQVVPAGLACLRAIHAARSQARAVELSAIPEWSTVSGLRERLPRTPVETR